MAWGWAEITEDDDLTDVTLWNGLLRAIHKRACTVGGYNLTAATPLANGVGAPYPQLTAFARDGLNGPDPLSYVSDAGHSFQWRSIAEMQGWAFTLALSFVHDPSFSGGIGGLPAADPAGIFWTQQTLAAALGRYCPPNPADVGSLPWVLRRQAPRRISSLTQDTSTEYLAIGGVTAPAFASGNLAQWYDGGRYRGVYRYPGSTPWVLAPEGSVADRLSSDESNGTLGYTPPGIARQWDYFGWWQLEDVRLLCDLCKWTFGGFPYFRSSSGTLDQADVQQNGSTFESSDLTARWSTGLYRYPSLVQQQTNYARLTRTVDYYLAARTPISGYFYDGGTGLPADVWSFRGSATPGLGGHERVRDDGPSFAGGSPSTTSFGGYDLMFATITKWTFDD